MSAKIGARAHLLFFSTEKCAESRVELEQNDKVEFDHGEETYISSGSESGKLITIANEMFNIWRFIAV